MLNVKWIIGQGGLPCVVITLPFSAALALDAAIEGIAEKAVEVCDLGCELTNILEPMTDFY